MTAPDPALSVILCTHNGSCYIREQIDAVLGQELDQPFELLVVDNNSTDGVADLVRAHTDDPRVRIVDAHDRQGLGFAHNRGVDAARGRWVTFVDDDDRIAPGYLAVFLRELQHHRVVCSRLVLDEINPPWLARVRSHPEVRGTGTFAGFTTGTFLGLEKALYLEAGGADEDLRSAEDIDFVIRLQVRTGAVPHWCADAIYHYRLRADARSNHRQGRSYGEALPIVYKRWRGQGTPYPAGSMVRGAATEVLRLLLQSPLCVRDRQRRLRWAFRLGLRRGRLVGSLRNRVLFL